MKILILTKSAPAHGGVEKWITDLSAGLGERGFDVAVGLAWGQHFHDPNQFGAYYDGILNQPDMWTPQSVQYTGWAQLQELGLMSDQGWVRQ